MIIGGITLDHDLVWEDEFDFTQGVGQADNTIYGNLVAQTFYVTGYRPLTLSGGTDYGWQSRATVLLLKALADTAAHVEHTVQLPNGVTVTAMFRNEEPPTVSFAPVTLATIPPADFWYSGTVKMRIVST